MNPWVLFAVVVGMLVFGTKKALAYINGQPASIDLAPIGNGFMLRTDAAAAFLAMAAAASDAGIPLSVDSAFRTQEQQTALFASYQAGTGNLAAEPGYSNHQGGIAVDIAVGRSYASAIYLWLARNGPLFGFENTVSGEPWHWEYRA